MLRARAQVERGSGQHHSLGLEKQIGGQTRLRLDGQEAKSAASLAAFLPVQLVLPNVAGLIFNGPADRREFLDWGVFHVKQDYVRLARQYRKVLRQRNAWLRDDQHGPLTEDPWMPMITETGQLISELREGYLATFSPIFDDILNRLDPDLDCVLA